MKRQLLSLQIIPDELDSYTDKNKIAELLGISLDQEQEPRIYFFKSGKVFQMSGNKWSNKEERNFFCWEWELDGFKLEDDNKEIEELKTANKTLGETASRVMKERDSVSFKLEDLQSDLLEADKSKVHKDLLLEIVAAAHGKKLN
tara:strand:+ start:86 stop:520 length:435 start_codon:yes stop_codon:yes gene_type:complete